MTIAEKITRAKQDYDDVYKAGEQIGFKKGHDAGYNEGLDADGYTEGFDAGKKAEHDAFWDGIFSGVNWQCKFYGSSWNDNTFFPNRDIKPSGFANNLFALCEITDLVGRLKECGVKLDTSGITNRCDYMFNYAAKITTIPYLDLRNSNYSNGVLSNMFTHCYNLKTIEGIHLSDDGSQYLGTSYGAFERCDALENITFYGKIGSSLEFKHSTKLTYNSIRSIVNALTEDPTKASGKKLTLSRAAVNDGFTFYIGEGYDPVLPEDPSNPFWQPLIAPKVSAGWAITLV